MDRYLPQPSDGMFPVRVNRQLTKRLDRMDTHAVLVSRADQLAIARAVETTERGLVGVAKISLKEATLINAIPHAEARFRAVADGGTAVILGRIYEAGL